MGRTVSSLLIAVLLMCPVMCARGHAARDSRGASADCCGCCQHQSTHSQHDDTGPADGSQRGQGHSCQCICGGAVVDDAAVVNVDFDWGWSVPLVPVAIVATQILDTELNEVSVAPWPDVGMNHGRALCCLYNTFLC